MFRRIAFFFGTILMCIVVWLNLSDRVLTFNIALSLILVVDYMAILTICIEYLESREKYKTKKSIMKLVGITLAILVAGSILCLKVWGLM